MIKGGGERKGKGEGGVEGPTVNSRPRVSLLLGLGIFICNVSTFPGG